MDGWTELTQMVIRARIRELELEAARARLAATAHASSPVGIRPIVGRLLIRTGRRIAGESAVAGSSAARPASSRLAPLREDDATELEQVLASQVSSGTIAAPWRRCERTDVTRIA